MSATDELLLACVKAACLQQKPDSAITSMDVSGDDWKHFLDACCYHRLLPFLVNRHAVIDFLPIHVVERMRKLALPATVRNLQLTAELLRLLKLFHQKNIVAVPFKGPVLSQRLYGGVGNRIYGDLDILVAADDVSFIGKLLVEQGYQPEIELPDFDYSGYVSHENNLTFVQPKTKIIVEIHWEITGPYLRRPLQLLDLTKCLDTLEIHGRMITIIGLEDLLLYLCVHGAKHRWERLEWICSIAMLIVQNSGLNWDEVLACAQSWRCRRMLYVGLFLACDLFDVRLPPDIRQKISLDKQVSVLAEKTYELIFPLHEWSQLPGHDRFSRYHLQIRDSGTDAVYYAMRLLFRPTMHEWQEWPSLWRLPVLYYGLRPLRLAREMFKQEIGDRPR